MTKWTLLVIAVGLGMDAFAVAVAAGVKLCRVTWRQAGRMALAFGGFQFAMPLLGWLGGQTVTGVLRAMDHWVAFGLLVIIGVKMMIEAWRGDTEKVSDRNPADSRILLVLAIATSLDALAVGLSLCVLDQPIVAPSLVIGLVTFCLCYAGVYVGRRFGHIFERKAELLGGLILVGIGVKILFDHIGV